MNNVFGGLFGRIEPGMCRLGVNGGIAVKTSTGYKSYNIKTGRLTNCDNFVFNVGEEIFFVIPTILPERHVILGNTYFYGKIVSMFGSNPLNGKNGTNKIMTYLMMSEMMKGVSGNSANGGMSSMLPLMMMNGGNFSDMFSGMFNFDMDDEEEDTPYDEEENA